MSMPTTILDIVTEKVNLVLNQQRRSFLAEGEVTARTRIDRINRAIGILVDHQDKLTEAVNADFGHRSPQQTLLTDIATSIAPFKHARYHLKRWMKRQRRNVDLPLGLFGTKAWVEYQPVGVVGLISPWNFPIQLTFGPLASILAAGNRVMIKPSEYTPATSELLKELIADIYDPNEVTVITGGAETGQIFSTLPFDHLMFTGSGVTGRSIMRTASERLVKVTLELGGKSPVIIGRGAPPWISTKRIMMSKLLNAGQVCLAPDYVLLPRGKVEEFVDTARKTVANMFPTLLNNPDYTSLINEHHHRRLQHYLEDARYKGGTVIELNPANEDFSQQPYHKMPPALVLDPHDAMDLMQNEIFGPILPIKQYDLLDEAIHYINKNDRPLAVYYFGNDTREEERVMSGTVSGGLVFNDAVVHATQEDLPFGGVGPSGQGCYKGRAGFLNFSHQKAVFRQSGLDVAEMAGVVPPWGSKLMRLMHRMIKR